MPSFLLALTREIPTTAMGEELLPRRNRVFLFGLAKFCRPLLPHSDLLRKRRMESHPFIYTSIHTSIHNVLKIARGGYKKRICFQLCVRVIHQIALLCLQQPLQAFDDAVLVSIVEMRNKVWFCKHERQLQTRPTVTHLESL